MNYKIKRDVNGNKVVKVNFPNDRGFSIQTLGNLPNTHRDGINNTTKAEVGNYLTLYGTKRQQALYLKNQENSMKTLSFVGIDSFNRPVFKSDKKFFGSVDVLFSYGATKTEVLSRLDVEDLEYFGNAYDCEPMGGERLTAKQYTFNN